MMVNLLTHICVTRPQWVINWRYPSISWQHPCRRIQNARVCDHWWVILPMACLNIHCIHYVYEVLAARKHKNLPSKVFSFDKLGVSDNPSFSSCIVWVIYPTYANRNNDIFIMPKFQCDEYILFRCSFFWAVKLASSDKKIEKKKKSRITPLQNIMQSSQTAVARHIDERFTPPPRCETTGYYM